MRERTRAEKKNAARKSAANRCANSPNIGGLGQIRTWFAKKGWAPFHYQEKAWEAYREGRSGLIQVATGSGKTWAALGGPLSERLEDESKKKISGLKCLYVTPLRALARDVFFNFQEILAELGLKDEVDLRTGDISSYHKQKQFTHPPFMLVTTPESVSVLLSNERAETLLNQLDCVVCDEWHELMGTKRGVLFELSLARLKALRPHLRVWGLSATLGNPLEAAQCLTQDLKPKLIQAETGRKLSLETLIPPSPQDLPWAGHYGSGMIDHFTSWCDPKRSTLIFTNTRNQAERWYAELLIKKPEWSEILALHHGSLAQEERERVEANLKLGRVKLVVCTSTLDLGIDFGPVETVVQIGSPKSVARLIQRAGRSCHYPGGIAQIVLVPTHILELLEVNALREVLSAGRIESRPPLKAPLDVLCQHLVTLAVSGGFWSDEAFRQVKGTRTYRDLDEKTWQDVIHFLVEGGFSLQRYPFYQKLISDDGFLFLKDESFQQIHRMNIGTISTEQTVSVRYLNKKDLGSMEESFLSRLKPGDTFQFAGRCLKLIRLKDGTATVKRVNSKPKMVPRWIGGRLPLSEELSKYIRSSFESHRQLTPTEKSFIQRVLDIQKEVSLLPEPNSILCEQLFSKEGQHIFVYPFEGYQVHESLGSLLIHRFAQNVAGSFTLSVNDYGFEILCDANFNFLKLVGEADAKIWDAASMEVDLRASLNWNELAKRKFREIAQISGLTPQALPSLSYQRRRRLRQVQASAQLIFEVFRKYEPDHFLLRQSYEEVLAEQLGPRLGAVLDKLLAQQKKPLEAWFKKIDRPSPLSFPLLVDRVSSYYSNESLDERVMRLKTQWSLN